MVLRKEPNTIADKENQRRTNPTKVISAVHLIAQRAVCKLVAANGIRSQTIMVYPNVRKSATNPRNGMILLCPPRNSPIPPHANDSTTEKTRTVWMRDLAMMSINPTVNMDMIHA